MKKLNAWLKKFFGIGKGKDVNRYQVVDGVIHNWDYPSHLKGYSSDIRINALKDGSSIIVDHNKKTVTLKMI